MADQPINETDYIKDVVPEQWQDGKCVGEWETLGRYIIALSSGSDSYYQLQTPITYAGDYEIEVDFIFDGSNLRLFGNPDTFHGRTFVKSTGEIQFRPTSNSAVTITAPAGTVTNGTHKLISRRIGAVGYLILNDVEVAQGACTVGDLILKTYGKDKGGNSDGVLLKAYSTDLDVPPTTGASTFHFDEFSSNTEVSDENNATIDYINIPFSARTFLPN